MPGGGKRRGSFDITQHAQNYAEGSDPLYQKGGLFVLWMLHVGPGWSWNVGGGQRDKKEGTCGPSLGQIYTKAEKNVLLVLWILEEFVTGYRKYLGGGQSFKGRGDRSLSETRVLSVLLA